MMWSIYVHVILWLYVLTVVNSVKDELAQAVLIADVPRVEFLLNLDPEILTSRPPVLVNRINKEHERTSIMLCGLDPQSDNITKIDTDCRKIVELLHIKGANLSHVDKYGWTALSMAASNGLSRVCSYLLDQNVTTDGQDSKGLTALMKAGAQGHSEVFKALYAKGSNVSVHDETGITALHHVVNLAMLNSSFISYLTDIVSFVSPSVVDTTVDKDGRNILMYAAIGNNVAVSKVLLEAGCDPTLKDSFGVSLSSMSRVMTLRSLIAEASVSWTEKKHKEWLKKTSRAKIKDL